MQLSNNTELSDWIKMHKVQLEDSISNVVFITNMNRKDANSGIWNEKSGV